MEEDWKPKVDMVFDSFEDAWKFWVDYGGKVGFGVRKQYTHHNKSGSIATCRFVCCKEGLRKPDKRDYKTINARPETRTGCKNLCGKLIVHDFIEEHNHILHLQETTHMLSSQRKVSEVQCNQIDVVNDAGLQQRKTFDLISKQVGGRTNLGYTRLDQKNYLRNRRQRSMVRGEADYLLQYFQRKLVEDPTFYHAYQLDSEDQITNVFWTDARMLVDYGYFGDVVSLDATYCTNSSHRPLVVFSGFNHHRKTVIFGAALLYDETADSYKWLFEKFLEAHKQKPPQTVFTDQDQAMMKALAEVMPGAYHGLCTWHLMQNGIKHLGNLMKGESHFLTDFQKCMYGYEDEEKFEEGWRTLLAKFDVEENTWLQRMYTMKEKWAYCHMKKTFSFGMRSTQISESVNAEIKGFTNVNSDIIKFFKRFEDVVEEKRYNELRCEYEARQKIPKLKNIYSNILQQVSELYTPTIFDIFQNEYELFEACCVKSMDNKSSQFDCVIAMEGDLGEWKVSYDSDKKSISCSCRKFETFGILCCHCIRVFIHLDVKSMPEQYILKRWTKLARSGTSPNVVLSNIVEDERLSTGECYAEICPRLIRIATEACRSPDTTMFLRKVVDLLEKNILEIQNKKVSVNEVEGLLNKVIELENNNDGSTHVRGFKKREGKRRSRRLRGWVERQLIKRKKIDNSNAFQSQEPTTNDDGKKGKMSMKGKGQQQVTKKRRGGNSSATQSQEPTTNDVGKMGMKKKSQQQITKKRRGDNSSATQSQETTMQTQFHYELSNTNAPTRLSIVHNQQSMESNEILSQFSINSFTSLLMAPLDEDVTTLTNP